MVRRTKDQWRQLIQQQVESGKNAAVFCRQHGINPNYFSLKKSRLGPLSASGFVKVVPETEECQPESGSDTLTRCRIIDLQWSASEPMDIAALSALLDRVLR